MKLALVTFGWTTAVLAVIAIPMVNMALFTASVSIFFGLLFGLVASTLIGRFTVFEPEMGWTLGVCFSVMCAYYVWNSLPAIIQTL